MHVTEYVCVFFLCIILLQVSNAVFIRYMEPFGNMYYNNYYFHVSKTSLSLNISLDVTDTLIYITNTTLLKPTYISLLVSGINLSKNPFESLSRQPVLLYHLLAAQDGSHQTADESGGVGIGLLTDTVLSFHNDELATEISHT